MADTLKKLAGTTAVPTANTTVYTVPANTTTVVTEIFTSNGTGSPCWLTLYLGGVMLIAAKGVLANDSLVIKLNTVLEAGATIVVQAQTANALGVYISGVEVV